MKTENDVRTWWNALSSSDRIATLRRDPASLVHIMPDARVADDYDAHSNGIRFEILLAYADTKEYTC